MLDEAVQNIDLRNLDKSGWKSYRFDEIAHNISERIDPNNTDLEVYIGLEHIDSESIHIKRSGTRDDVNGQKLRFYPGDVIFGRRRAYQRKAGIAKTDGFCSAHALVLRANPDVIDPNLFPFFLHSDAFMHRAIDISVGSLSPTINWGTIKKQKFLLPPRAQQAILAELLWAKDVVLEQSKVLSTSYDKFYEAFLNDVVSGGQKAESDKWLEFNFGELGATFSGLTGKSKKDFGVGEPFITYMNVFKNSRVNTSMVDFVRVEPGETQNVLKYGDVLITGSSETPDELGMVSVFLDDTPGYYLNSFCFGFRLHNFKTLLPEFARFLMHSKHVRLFMLKHAQGSTRFNLSKTTLKERLTLKLPPISEQELLSEKLTNLERILTLNDRKVLESKKLLKNLINQVF